MASSAIQPKIEQRCTPPRQLPAVTPGPKVGCGRAAGSGMIVVVVLELLYS
jgi:hypothetical protein